MLPKVETMATRSQKDTAASRRDQSRRFCDNERVVVILLLSAQMVCSSGERETSMYVKLIVVVVNGSKQIGLESIPAKNKCWESVYFIYLFCFCFYFLFIYYYFLLFCFFFLFWGGYA